MAPTWQLPSVNRLDCGQGDADRQKYNRDLLHGKYHSPDRMQQRLGPDSRKFLPQRKTCAAIAVRYSTIFISAVSVKMSST